MKRKNRVLAIDDEPSMTDWLKVLLEHAGYEVKTGGSATLSGVALEDGRIVSGMR